MDDEAPLAEPFDGPPSAALAAGYCPFCLGTGKVYRFVPTEGIRPCAACKESGVWRP